MTPKEQLEQIKIAHVEAHIESKNEGDFDVWFEDYYEEIKQSLNELERLKKFKETFDNYELAKKQGFIAYENWLECENELEELKRDVARYFDLSKQYLKTMFDDDEPNEIKVKLDDLYDKLSKVGKEE